MLMRLSMMAPGTQTLRLPRLWVLIRPVVAQHSAAGRHQQALLAYYRALSLDAGLVSAAKNALVALNRWARTFADADNYERAIALLDIGLTLAPIDRSIRHNRRVVWQQRVSHTARDGSPEQVLAKAGQWADAIAITAPASERVNEVSLRSLKRFQVSVFSRWLMAAIDATQWPEALKAVSKAKTYLPADNRVRRNAAYPLQEWSEHAVAHQDTGAGVEAARSVLDVYPDAHQVKRAARGFVGRRLQALGKHADLAPALDLAKQSIVLLPACHDQQEMLATVVNTQVRQHIDARRWQQAFEVYKVAVTQLPDNKQKSYLKNLPFVAQEWLRDASDNNGPVARSLIADFGDVHKVRQIIGAHFQCAVLAQQKVGDFEESVRVASDGQAVLGDSAESKKIWSALHLTDGLSIIASRSNGWLQRRFMSRHCNDYLVIPNSIAMPLPPGMPGPPPIWM